MIATDIVLFLDKLGIGRIIYVQCRHMDEVINVHMDEGLCFLFICHTAITNLLPGMSHVLE